MKVNRNIIRINEDKCDGCGRCVPSCAEGAIQVIDGKAKLVSEKYCDGLGACLGICPNDALKVTEEEVEEFDEKAVTKHLQAKEPPQHTLPCGCPPMQIKTFAPRVEKADTDAKPAQESYQVAFKSRSRRRRGIDAGVHFSTSRSMTRRQQRYAHEGDLVSTLAHWPVKIRLVPAKAPFLKGADLLVAADCTPVAYPNFHADFLKGRAVMVGCPKFDDVDEYIQKFAGIFKTADIKSVTVVVMEVPCCQGLPFIIQKGLALAGKKIPLEKVIISAQGEILKRENLAA